MLMGSDYNHLKHGDKAQEFILPGTDGKNYSLNDFKGKLVLIVFMCNHCPYVIPKIEELKRISSDFKDKGLVVIGINSNEDVNYPEDSFENMKKMVVKENINFIYLRDESQEIAKLYGAVCTPDPFLFDFDHKLIFHSRIDDTHEDDFVNEHELYSAIKQFLDEGKINLKEKPSMGCSIKWKY